MNDVADMSAAYEGLMRAKEAFRAEAHRLARELADAKEALEAMQRGWQPIETAPKDGSLVLLFCDHGDDDPEIRICHWEQPIGKPGPFGHYVWQLQDDGGAFAERIVTHWMPLPLPPSRSGRVEL